VRDCTTQKSTIVDKPLVTNITTRILATDAIYKTRERLSSAGIDNDRDDRSVSERVFIIDINRDEFTSIEPYEPNSATETYSARRMFAARR